MTRERKLLAGVLLVAVSALVLDRGIFGPQQASAGAVPSGSLVALAAQLPTSAAVPAEPVLMLRPSVVSGPLAEAAERLGITAADTGDAFAGMRPKPAEPQVAQTSSPSAQGSIGLTAVMPKQRMAIFNGSPVAVGERIGTTGYRLIEVRERSAMVEREGNRTELTLPRVPLHRP